MLSPLALSQKGSEKSVDRAAFELGSEGIWNRFDGQEGRSRNPDKLLTSLQLNSAG